MWRRLHLKTDNMQNTVYYVRVIWINNMQQQHNNHRFTAAIQDNLWLAGTSS